MKKQLLYITAILISLIATNCSKKTTPVKTTVQKTTVIDIVDPMDDINPNCATFATLSSSDRENAETAYVLYRDELKQNNYKVAKQYWKIAYYLAPAANGRVKYQFDDGIKIYQHLYKNTTDKHLKERYIDTIMSIYDLRLECVKDTSYVMGRKAYEYFYTFPGTLSDDELFDLLATTMDKSGKKVDYFIINPFTQMLIERYKEGKIDKPTTKKYTYQILDAVDYGLKHCKRDCDAWRIVGDYAPVRLETFEGLKDFYECDYYIDHYYGNFTANGTDCEIIKETYRKLKRGHCDENGTAFTAIKQAKAQHCKVIVTAPGPCRSGYTAYTNGQYKDAIAQFESCIESQSDQAKKAKYTLLIAKIYYRDLKQFGKARKFALKAAALRPGWGEPYMLIGTLYASSGPQCGPGTGFESQKVVWPAIDKWAYAKKIDPSVAAEANKLINKYKKYMPTREDLHQRSIKKGSTYKVGCWINENTKARVAN